MSTFNPRIYTEKSTVKPKSSTKRRPLPRSIKQLSLVLLMEKTHHASSTPTPRTRPRRKLPRPLASSRISSIRPSRRCSPSSTTLVRYAQIFRSWRVSTSKSRVRWIATTTCSWMRPPWPRLTIALLSLSSVLRISNSKCKMLTVTFRIWSDNSRTSKVKLMTPKTKNSMNYYHSKMNKTTSGLFKFSKINRQKWEKLCKKGWKSATRGTIYDNPSNIDFKTTSKPHNEHS